MKDYLTLSFLVIIISGFWSCEDPVDKDNNSADQSNTLNDASVGNGVTGYIDDYFYNFEDYVDVDFFRFDNTIFDFTYSEYHSLYNREPASLNFKTYPELILADFQPGLDTSAYLTITPDSPESLTRRSLIDSLTNFEIILEDSVTLYSIQYKNIESLNWEIDLQRYKPINSDWIDTSKTILFSDTLVSLSYSAVVDTLIDEGMIFVDRGEWVNETTIYAPEKTLFSTTFEFPSWKTIGKDSLMFRVNTDCNDNGVLDNAETVDVGNEIWDPAEVYYDYNNDGVRNLDEPFEDRNCNGVWDDAEEKLTDINGDGDSTDVVDGVFEFEDKGNGQIDPAEVFTDLNGNGEADPGELFVMGSKPDRLLVSWADPQNPIVFKTIHPGDSIKTRWGLVFHDLIKDTTRLDFQKKLVDDIDSTVTLYTNRVIEYINDNSGIGDYYITKTQWSFVDAATGNEVRDYDYHLFKKNGNIYKLIHPSYFKPYGYYWQPSERADGFWYKENAVDEVLYYTSNGLIRDGERVFIDYYDTTRVAIYHIEKSYAVDADVVTVPAKILKGELTENGLYSCYADPELSFSVLDSCPAVDTTFADCFRITREMTMTMIGNGVEYGERNISWLVKNYGIVKDELWIRWSEPLEAEGEFWVGYSRWEMGKFSSSQTGLSKILGGLLKKAHIAKLSEFNQTEELNNDPFKIRRTVGLQRVELQE